MNKYEFYSKLLQEDFPVKYRQDFAEHDSEQCKKIQDLKVHLAEAVGLLRNIEYAQKYGWEDSDTEALQAFLARNAQAEQQEFQGAKKEAQPVAGERFSQIVKTDCRTEEGVTVGIVDAIITLARVMKGRNQTKGVSAALDDLRQDEDVARLFVPPAAAHGGEET